MSNQVRRIPNSQLRNERFSRNWSQQELATHLGTTTINVSRWERGITTPSPYFRQQLCHLFGKSVEELGLLQGEGNGSDKQISVQKLQDVAQHASDIASPIWNIPYRRNPFFTGREQFLLHLHTILHAAGNSSLSRVQAISGMGGIGKTQAAIEYAYRFRSEYEAILWVRADTHALLVEDFAGLAQLLYPEKNEKQEQRKVIDAVLHWFSTHSNWLLILDNAEDIATICSYIPPDIQGHILLTTRTQATGMWSQRVSLEGMSLDDGIVFLLRRAKLIEHNISISDVPEKLRASATDIAQMMDGLPLALDQVGAYIEETGCSLSDYLVDWQHYHTTLLAYRGEHIVNHPQSISTTLSLSFEKIEQLNPTSAELLQFCSFLHPDAIPEEIFTRGAVELGAELQSIGGDPVTLNLVVALLRNYSLLHRNPDTKTFTLHRLVQTLIKDRMSKEKQLLWATRVVHALARSFPKGEEAKEWTHCERLLAHVNVAFALTEQWNIVSPKIGYLFENVGVYLRERGSYVQAEVFLNKACHVLLTTLGEVHADVYRCQQHVALLYSHQGRYTEVESLLQQVLVFREHTLGEEHIDTSETLNDLGVLYWNQGLYARAEPLLQRALTIWEQQGKRGPEMATILNNLGLLHTDQGYYSKAEPLLQQTLAIWEQQHDPHPGYVAHALDNLARLFVRQGRFQEAEPLHQRALLLQERELGPMHPETARSLSNLAFLYLEQARYDEAELLYRRSLAIQEDQFGPTHIQTAISLNGLALLYQEQEKYCEAEALFQRALSIREHQLGMEHPSTVKSLDGLATLYQSQHRYSEAEPLLQRILLIQQRDSGLEHPDTRATAERYSSVKEKRRKQVEDIAIENAFD